jgi:hypothetical protein
MVLVRKPWQMADTAYVKYDVGVGVPGSNHGANNGCLEFLFNETSNTAWDNSAEETTILAASPQFGADVHVYFVAGTGLFGDGRFGLFPTVYSASGLKVRNPVLGHAGKSGYEARGGRVYVWNYTRSGDDPTHVFTIAHEIMHYVAQVGHSTDEITANNFMPNMDSEKRLMTGLEGPKRKLGPKKLIKMEWQRLNGTYGFNPKN